MSEPIEIRLCDDAGMVSDERVEPGSPGLIFDPDLTYRKLLNNLRAATGLPPSDWHEIHCTGSAHLAAETFRCTSPAHWPLLLVIRDGVPWCPWHDQPMVEEPANVWTCPTCRARVEVDEPGSADA